MKANSMLVLLLFLQYKQASAQEKPLTLSDKLWLNKPERRFQFWAGGGLVTQRRIRDFGSIIPRRKLSNAPIYTAIEGNYASTYQVGTPFGLGAHLTSQTRLNRWFALNATLEGTATTQYIKWKTYDKDPNGYTLTGYDPTTATFQYERNQVKTDEKIVFQPLYQAGITLNLVFQLPGGRFGLKPGFREVFSYQPGINYYNNHTKSIYYTASMSAFYALTPRLRVDVQYTTVPRHFKTPTGYFSSYGVNYGQYVFSLSYQLTRPRQ